MLHFTRRHLNKAKEKSWFAFGITGGLAAWLAARAGLLQENSGKGPFKLVLFFFF